MTTPTRDAMLICDNVITEVGTGKKSLIGIFENINAHKFPSQIFELSVYVKFTSAKGKYIFKLELNDLQENKVIGRAATPELMIEDKLGSNELAFKLRGLIFTHPGKYEFIISANDKQFANKTFNVKHIIEEKKE